MGSAVQAPKAYFINSDAKSNNGTSYHNEWISRGIAVTSGGEKYAASLAKVRRGDTLLLWVNGKGLVAIGMMLDDEPVHVTAGAGTVSPLEKVEYHRTVAWNGNLEKAPITAKEVVAFCGTNPRSTLASLIRGKDQIMDLAYARSEMLDIAEIEDQTVERSPTSVLELTQARLGQGKYRDGMLALWDSKCAVTGCDLLAVIRASHAKAWRHSNDVERLDPNNGLPLIATLDALFDRGLIGFDDEGKMLVSATLQENDMALLGLPQNLRRAPTDNQRIYLGQHRDRYALKK
jgi:putative restriction endonuclease